jgi:hypothetical protein
MEDALSEFFDGVAQVHGLNLKVHNPILLPLGKLSERPPTETCPTAIVRRVPVVLRSARVRCPSPHPMRLPSLTLRHRFRGEANAPPGPCDQGLSDQDRLLDPFDECLTGSPAPDLGLLGKTQLWADAKGGMAWQSCTVPNWSWGDPDCAVSCMAFAGSRHDGLVPVVTMGAVPGLNYMGRIGASGTRRTKSIESDRQQTARLAHDQMSNLTPSLRPIAVLVLK